MSSSGAGQTPLMHGSKGVDVAADWAPQSIGGLAQSMHVAGSSSPKRAATFYCGNASTGGHDVVRGTASPDYLCGAGGADWIHGYASGDQISGGAGNDRTGASSILAGDAGDDLIFARALSNPTGDCDNVDGGTGLDTAWVDKSPVPCGNGTSAKDVWANTSVTRPP
jgi:Ca2+-binding RTX toxin-like protein